MDKDQLITVCTASYNRGSLLPLLYASLKVQTHLHFEWIIIDDGSTDDTTNRVSAMQKDAPFDIIYHKQSNQGKHIAINKGVELAKGTSFFIVDSDDRLPEDSLAIIHSKFSIIKDNPTIAGVVGLKCYFDKKVVGSGTIKDDIICDLFEYRYTLKIKGDRAEVFKTDILKKYPFPKFDDEKFVPESIIWNRIAQKYSMLFFNENVYECEYLEDGLSANSIFLRRKYPKGVLHLYSELGVIQKIGTINKWKSYINFWRFFFCDTPSFKNLHLIKKSHIAYLLFPIGIFLYTRDSLIQKGKL